VETVGVEPTSGKEIYKPSTSLAGLDSPVGGRI